MKKIEAIQTLTESELLDRLTDAVRKIYKKADECLENGCDVKDEEACELLAWRMARLEKLLALEGPAEIICIELKLVIDAYQKVTGFY